MIDIDLDAPEHCVFCRMDRERIIAASAHSFAIRDGFPVSLGHTLVIPKRHVRSVFALMDVEINDCMQLLASVRERLKGPDFSYRDFNVGINDGEFAGQTVSHAHIHLIPRRGGDVPNPRGGVRGVIPSKKDYTP